MGRGCIEVRGHERSVADKQGCQGPEERRSQGLGTHPRGGSREELGV